ncbi:MAG: hypothetical protein DMG70_21200 [Acidobacteria bacterium]|nr:MAG: hypothetical protein DMG70_21200 [Acidobacteriota bacterium]
MTERTALREFREKEWRPTSPDFANSSLQLSALYLVEHATRSGAKSLHTVQVQRRTARWRAFGLPSGGAPFYNASNLQPTVFESATKNKWFQRFPEHLQ